MSEAKSQTVLSLLNLTTDYFRKKGLGSPRVDAEILLAHLLECKRLELYMMHDRPLEADKVDRFRELVRQRAGGTPVQHLTGSQAFRDLTLQVSEKALIPRPETEGLVEAILERIAPEGDPATRRVLELGVGTGAIALSLAKAWPNAQILGTDISLDALEVARGNADYHNLNERVAFLHGDLFDPLSEAKTRFDLIVSNPPYIPTADIATLDSEVRDHEPVLALDGGADGLGLIRTIIADAARYLSPAGWLFLEIGYDQGPAVLQLLNNNPAYVDAAIAPDMAGRDRIALARIKPND